MRPVVLKRLGTKSCLLHLVGEIHGPTSLSLPMDWRNIRP
jgi:hypothetical protein